MYIIYPGSAQEEELFVGLLTHSVDGSQEAFNQFLGTARGHLIALTVLDNFRAGNCLRQRIGPCV
jgi:hypothetical protein